MDEGFRFPFKRLLLLYAGTVGVLFVAGVVWAVTEHRHVVFCTVVFYYIAAAAYTLYGVLSQSASRTQYLLLTIEERRIAFWTHVFFLLVAALVAATAVALQLVF